MFCLHPHEDYLINRPLDFPKMKAGLQDMWPTSLTHAHTRQSSDASFVQSSAGLFLEARVIIFPYRVYFSLVLQIHAC